MSPLYVLAVVGLSGVVLWAVNTLLPMQPKFKQVFNVLAVLFLGLWLISLLLPGVWATIMGIRLGSEPLVNVLGVIAVVGLVVWAIGAIITMPPKYKQALHVLAVVALCFWVVSLFVPSLGHLGH